MPNHHPARFRTPLPEGAFRCDLCPRRCVIAQGHSGWCGMRRNVEGELLALSYARPAAIAIDPIEKKPLMDFLPGTRTLSLGAFGCNLDCLFCQNSTLSRGSYNADGRERILPPHEVISLAKANLCPSISLTYNEPTLWIEYAMDIAKLAHANGIKTVLVTNGFINPDPARALYPLFDAANIDVKGFREAFYHSMCGGKLAPIKTACEIFKNESGGHLELTNLVIPGQNDSSDEQESYLDWVEAALGIDTPLHFNAFFPAYRYRESPRTPATLLYKLRDRALKRGFRRVRVGNL